MNRVHSLRAHYYNPAAGLFLSRDSWAYNFQDLVKLNRYIYYPRPIKLGQNVFLTTLNFAIHVRFARTDRAELDGPFQE